MKKFAKIMALVMIASCLISFTACGGGGGGGSNGGGGDTTGGGDAGTYTVKFDKNGGSGSMSDKTYNRGEWITLPKNTFTKTDYSFEGWAMTSSGDVEYQDEDSVKNLGAKDETVKLYAKWKSNSSGGEGGGSESAVDNKKIKVFLLAGQSNAVGVTDVWDELDFFNAQTDLTPTTIPARAGSGGYESQYVNDDVLFYTDGEMGMSGTNFLTGAALSSDAYPYNIYCKQWRNVSTGFGIHSGCFGPEIGMANVLGQMYPKDNSETPYNVAIIKYAFGGTGLAELWLSESGFPNYYPNTANSRKTKYNNKDVGLLYANFMNTVEGGMLKLQDMGYEPEVEGFAWMQGCNDAWGTYFANNYEEMLQCMVNDVRANMLNQGFSTNANLPVSIGEIKITLSIESERIRQEQKSLCNNDANCHFVSAKDLNLKVNDWWHFDSISQYKLGRRFASKLFFASEETDMRDVQSADAITFANSTGTTYTLPQFAEVTLVGGQKIPCEVTWSAYSKQTSEGTTQVSGTVYGGEPVTANVVTGTAPIVDGKIDDLVWGARSQVSLQDGAGSYVQAYANEDGLYLAAKVFDKDITCWQEWYGTGTNAWYRFIDMDQVAFYIDSSGNTTGSFTGNKQAIGVYLCAINVASVYVSQSTGVWTPPLVADAESDFYRNKDKTLGYYGFVKHAVFMDGKNAVGDPAETSVKVDNGYELELFVPYSCFGGSYANRNNIRINAGRINMSHSGQRTSYTISGETTNTAKYMFEYHTLDKYKPLSDYGTV